jgi:hypothetical protein
MVKDKEKVVHPKAAGDEIGHTDWKRCRRVQIVSPDGSVRTVKMSSLPPTAYIVIPKESTA